jgi:transcriptional regulator with XRE-family HTH domain
MRLVGTRVRELRLAKGLRQEDMCQSGFKYKFYQRIDYGQKNLSLKTLNKLPSNPLSRNHRPGFLFRPHP